MKYADFVSGLTKDDLKELGAALFSQSLFRTWCVLEGANAARDTQEPGELFRNSCTDHLFTNLVEDVGNRLEAIAHRAEMLPEAPALHERSVEIRKQLQAEARNMEQMR